MEASNSPKFHAEPQDSLQPKGSTVAKEQLLLTWFKEWKDVEHMRILCCTQGSPEEIERMWIILKEREKAFEACFAF